MNRRLFYWFVFLLPTLLLSGLSEGKEAVKLLAVSIEDEALPKGWKPLTFKKVKRHTTYRTIEKEGRIIILAESDRSASGLIRPLDLDPKTYQTISWCWKIDQIISKGDVRKKEGDDYAARIYVTFKYDPEKAGFFEKTTFGTYKLLYGEYPPKAALNYVWANQLEKGRDAPNAYTDRAHMIAVESGSENTGKWLCEERNLYEDYQQYFGGEPPRISGIAVMTDTDNTGETAKAAYADLILK